MTTNFFYSSHENQLGLQVTWQPRTKGHYTYRVDGGGGGGGERENAKKGNGVKQSKGDNYRYNRRAGWSQVPSLRPHCLKLKVTWA